MSLLSTINGSVIASLFYKVDRTLEVQSLRGLPVNFVPFQNLMLTGNPMSVSQGYSRSAMIQNLMCQYSVGTMRIRHLMNRINARNPPPLQAPPGDDNQDPPQNPAPVYQNPDYVPSSDSSEEEDPPIRLRNDNSTVERLANLNL